MATRKKKSVHLNFSIEGGQWVARGGKVDVTGPTLQATRRRARKAAEQGYGAEVEIESTLHIPSAFSQRIEANKARRAELRRARAELREETVAILEVLRNELGASYEDASTLLGVDASVLMRTVHSTRSIQLGDD